MKTRLQALYWNPARYHNMMFTWTYGSEEKSVSAGEETATMTEPTNTTTEATVVSTDWSQMTTEERIRHL